MIEEGVAKASVKNVSVEQQPEESKENSPKPLGQRFIEPVEVNTPQENQDKRIAVVSMSCRFPMSRTLEDFWHNLSSSKSMISEVPADRWNIDQYYSPDRKAAQKTYSKWGGFIDDVDKFDPFFFSIPPNEAKLMDPQERLFIEAAWHVLEDAGITRKEILKKGLKHGVFVGAMHSDYESLAGEMWLPDEPNTGHSSLWTKTNYVQY